MADELRQGALLCNGAYRIERKLGQGGFGITYLARELKLDRLVAIKEYFPKDYCGRDDTTSHVKISTDSAEVIFTRYKEKFLKEAKNIAKLKHPNIIKIYNAFEEYGTAYYVMEYIEGMSLAEMVDTRRTLSVSGALEYIKGVGAALSYVHARSINHLDVKPANIMVSREDNCPILIDFGLSKQYDVAGKQTSTTLVGLSHGYAPLEQYYNAERVSRFSPQTDIYSLAATLYFLLTGVTPPAAPQLSQEGLQFPATIPMQMRGVIATAMSANPAQRYPTVEAFLAALSLPQSFPYAKSDDHTVIVDPVSASQPVSTPRPAPIPQPAAPWPVQPTRNPIPRKPTPPIRKSEQPKKNNNNKFLLWGGIGFVAVLVVVLIVVFLQNRGSDSANLSAATAIEDGLYYDESTSELVYGSNRYKMVQVDGGIFSMGATSEQENPFEDEMPVHSVTLSSYSIGQNEVPQWLWVAVMGNNPSYFNGDDLPVETVSLYDCQSFINKLNRITGKSFRLPTEAQWEFAARGGNQRNGYQYSGGDYIYNVAWYDGNSGGHTHEVGSKDANELGLYDMSGNVWEWCSDWKGDYPNYSVENPEGPSYGSNRVIRGGCWNISPRNCRVSERLNFKPEDCNSYLGFRLAM